MGDQKKNWKKYVPKDIQAPTNPVLIRASNNNIEKSATNKDFEKTKVMVYCKLFLKIFLPHYTRYSLFSESLPLRHR